MQPNANLTLLHCVLFTAAMLALLFWGVAGLEAELAAQAETDRAIAAAIIAAN